jgi:hypothetical protein
MHRSLVAIFVIATSTALFAQDATSPGPNQATQSNPQASGELKQREQAQPANGIYRIEPGTHILLNMINSISTKQAVVGDRIYLETAFPVLAAGRIVIPQGSWVTGTVTEVKRPGRVKGRGELQVRFDSLTLPNGVNRNFRADLGALDARNEGSLKREDSKINGPDDKKGDVGTVVGTTAAGTVIGSGVGAAAGNVARGAGIGAGGGAAAGLLGVLLTRGPDASLPKGSTVEMVLDRPIDFDQHELDFSNAPPRAILSDGGEPPTKQQRGWPSRLPY